MSNENKEVAKPKSNGPRITKSNYLVQASYRLTLNEQRLVAQAISMVDPRRPLKAGENKFTILASEFAKTWNIPLKQAYEAMDDAAAKLYERTIKTADPANKTRESIRWVSSVKYWDAEGKVTLGFSLEVLPYLTKQRSQFTSYFIQNVSQFSTPITFRLYEMVSQFRSTGTLHITLDAIRDALMLEDKYTVFADFRRRVLDPAIENINTSSDLTVTWEPKKTGRAITGLLFTIVEDKQKKLPV
jgi:plasmid replication initiation protein